ncbi:hypothetical protein ACF0H5_008066 [Mactra antiquata]
MSELISYLQDRLLTDLADVFRLKFVSKTSRMSDADVQNDMNDKQVNIEETYVETQPDEFCTKTYPADLTLIVEDRSLLVSKSLLVNQSPVFDAMLSEGFKEKDMQSVKLPGKKFNDFVEFMRCLNPHISKAITVENVFKVLPLAHEYQVKYLLPICEVTLIKFLCKSVGEELFRLLKLATMYNLQDLTAKCIETAAERPPGEIEDAGRTHELDTNTINAVKAQMLTNLTSRHKDIFVHITTSQAMYRFLGIQSKQLKLVKAFKDDKVFGDCKQLSVSTKFNELTTFIIDGDTYSVKFSSTTTYEEKTYISQICVKVKRKSDQAHCVECVCGIYIKNWMEGDKDIYEENTFPLKGSSNYEYKLPSKYQLERLAKTSTGYKKEGMFDVELYLFIMHS